MSKNDRLTDEELREMLMRRKIRGREARIASYRASGRVVDPEHAPVNSDLVWNSETKKTARRGVGLPFRVLDAVLLLVRSRRSSALSSCWRAAAPFSTP